MKWAEKPAILGQSIRFLWAILEQSTLTNFRSWVVQIHFCGVLSLPIIFLSGFFVGMVLALQMYYALSYYGAVESVGYLVALSLVRELGPVVTALLYAARTGSALTASISMMRSREEIKALSAMGINIWEKIFFVRFISSILVVPVLAVLFSVVGILGCYVVSVSWFHIDSGVFWLNITNSLLFLKDVVNGILKSFVFGIVVTWVSLFLGYVCPPTVFGMSRATTQTVVMSSLLIFVLDFMMTSFMFSI
ncbi:MlaE family lipid ABC transporter permease subunit [Candidatus Ichthyocystis hellenicum]|uniref:MlaE family lipid ABC transporter permease subunit n=1 Tax=Candidatus Ichthyocystis hellenicum TaxID=1561003 RepID=UPI000B8A3824|nr:MlaE family lipid ABC transporter permease subunit [Candidatus Ichthyocystis hellenicum]